MAQVSFKGNIGKVRELKFLQDGKAMFGFSVGESHSKPDGNGGWIDEGTTWWAVSVFGKLAEALAEVIGEGKKQRVTVAGRSKTRTYEANGEQRTSLDVLADHVGIIPSVQQGQSNQSGWGAPQQAQQPAQQQQQGGWGQPPAADGWGAQNVAGQLGGTAVEEPPF